MNEKSGKVIDGTARARHWRSSRPGSRAKASDGETRSDAPKSFASSLMMPPSVRGTTTAAGGGNGASDRNDPDAQALLLEEADLASDGSTSDRGHQNLFLGADAAVADEASRRAKHETSPVLRLVRAAPEWLRRTRPGISALRPSFRLAIVARVALLVVLVVGAAVAFELVGHPRAASAGRSSGNEQTAELLGVKGGLLSLGAAPFADEHVTSRPRAARLRVASRPAVHRASRAHAAAQDGRTSASAGSGHSSAASTLNAATQSPSPSVSAPTEPTELSAGSATGEQSSSATTASAPRGSGSSSGSQPAHPGPNGALTCITNCGNS